MGKRKLTYEAGLRERFNLPAPRKREVLPERERLILEAEGEKVDEWYRRGEYFRKVCNIRYGE